MDLVWNTRLFGVQLKYRFGGGMLGKFTGLMIIITAACLFLTGCQTKPPAVTPYSDEKSGVPTLTGIPQKEPANPTTADGASITPTAGV